MNKNILLLFLIFMFSCSFAQWNCKDPVSSTTNFYVSIADDSIGYILPEARLLCTLDQGKTWVQKTLLGYNSSMQFLNSDTGFVAGGEGLRRTTDRGDTWEVVLDVYTESVCFVNNKVGYVSGDSYAKGMYKTSDGGNTWNLLPGTKTYHGKHLACPSEQVCFVFSPLYKDYFTINGDQTWQMMDEDLDIFVSDSYFFNDQEGFVLGSLYGSGYLFKTINGCKSFELVYSTSERLSDIYFVDSLRGFLLGGYIPGIPENPLLLITMDRGKTWHNKNPVCNT